MISTRNTAIPAPTPAATAADCLDDSVIEGGEGSELGRGAVDVWVDTGTWKKEGMVIIERRKRVGGYEKEI